MRDTGILHNALGWLMLSWKCDHPSRGGGVVYLLSRQLDGAGEFVHIGFTGRKRFEDATVPPGTRTVTYQVQAVRSNTKGQAAQHSVQFGSRGVPIGMRFNPARGMTGYAA